MVAGWIGHALARSRMRLARARAHFNPHANTRAHASQPQAHSHLAAHGDGFADWRTRVGWVGVFSSSSLVPSLKLERACARTNHSFAECDCCRAANAAIQKQPPLPPTPHLLLAHSNSTIPSTAANGSSHLVATEHSTNNTYKYMYSICIPKIIYV